MDSKLKYLAIFIVTIMIMGSFVSPNALSFDPSFKMNIASGCGFMDLSWDSVPGAKGYFIYRGEGYGNQDPSPLEDFPISGVTYHDSTHIYKGKNYCYFVRAVGSDKREFAQSYEVCAEAKCSSTDVRPPNECKLILKFKVGSKIFWVNDAVQPEMTTAPIIKWNKTFLVIKYVAETIGGKVDWDGNARKVTITARNMVIQMWIGKNTAIINGKNTPIDSNNPDVVPVIENGRTLLPLRFVGNNLGAKEILWDKDTYIAELHFDDPTCGEETPDEGTPGEGGSGGSGGESGTGPSGSVNDDYNVIPSTQIESSGSYSLPKGSVEKNEEFETGLGNSWLPVEGGGGVFDKHVNFSGGEMVVNVPEGNAWGSTGIKSKEHFFIASNDPYSIVFDIDQAKTSGFVIVLSDIDTNSAIPWNVQNVWITFHQSPNSAQAHFAIANLTNSKDSSKTLNDINNKPPEKVTVTVKGNSVTACTSFGYSVSGNFAWLKPGIKVFLYVFSQSIDGVGQPVKFGLKSIKTYKAEGCTAGAYTPPYDNLVYTEEFDSYNQTMWQSTEGGGGSFKDDAKFESGAFNTVHPKNKWWGKTGIKSKYYSLQITEEMKTHPYTVILDFDSAKTNGFVTAISSVDQRIEPWNVECVWVAFHRHEYGTQTTFAMTNQATDKDSRISNGNMPWTLPSKVAITIWPGKVKLTTSQGFTAEGSYSWIKPGVKIFFYALNHPFDAEMPSAMSLKSVKIYRSQGASFPQWTPPMGQVRFKEDFTAGDRGGMWQTFGSAGGDFKKFGRFENGALAINVPESNGWGKTGITSEHYTFNSPADMSTAPLVYYFELDPAKSTGFRLSLTKDLALSGGGIDPWNSSCIWTGFSIDSNTNKGFFYLSNNNTRDNKNFFQKDIRDLPPNSPSWVRITVKLGYAKVETSLGQTLDGEFEWIKVGLPIYLLAFSHPYDAGQASSLYLKSITITR